MAEKCWLIVSTVWHKEMAVLRGDRCLFLYTHYLLGEGAGTPLIGSYLHLDECVSLKVEKKENEVLVEAMQKNKRKRDSWPWSSRVDSSTLCHTAFHPLAREQ